MTRSSRPFLFATALVACSVVALAWGYTRLMPMRFLESGYPIWVAKQTILRQCQFGSILVLGDSRAESAIVPAELPYPAANITFGGTTPVETYFFAREAAKCAHPPQLVLYAHSLPSYLRPNQGLWKTATRFGYISYRDLRDIAAVAERVHDGSLAAIDTHDGLTGVVRDAIYGIGFPSIFMASLVEARGWGRYTYNDMLLHRTAVTRGQVIYPEPANKVLVGGDADVSAFVPSALETTYLDQTLDLFDAAHVRVVLFAIPAGVSTVKAIAPQVKADFSRFLIEHSQRHQGVSPGVDGLFGWPDDFYIDGSHMNERGAKAFTARLAICLRQWNADPERAAPCDLEWK